MRRFGLLAVETTPCGQPLPVSYAHALMVLDATGDDAPTMAKLARELGIDKSDGRARRLRLTAEGRRLARQVERWAM